MWAKTKNQHGFTIVELLIVIVVIAILAAITIVAYNGIQDRARVSTAVSALNQASKKIGLWRVDNPTLYPATMTDAGITDTPNVAFQYTVDNAVSPATYCLTATYGTLTYYVSSSVTQPQPGVCSGYNTLTWDKVQALNSPPVSGATADTSTFRTSTASMRLAPGAVGRNLLGVPYSGTPGQTVYTVSMWVKTDPTWNGTNNNSKIRFGDASTGGIISACGYGGAKASWTMVTCSQIVTSGAPTMNISVGNDGTIGNIWIDDLSLSRAN